MDSDKINKDHSAVYSWFEEHNIISHIRTHLRTNLINILKKKDLSLIRNSRKPKSVKQYIYDLLIAEYLFNLNYTCTLSVFASEAPLLVNMNDFSSKCLDRRENGKKLLEDYVSHTLETLGIKLNDAKGQYILLKYESESLPLLQCILMSLTINKSDNAILTSNMYSQSKHVQTEFSVTVNNSELAKLCSIEKKLLHQKKLFSNQLKEKELKLKGQTVIIRQQLMSINEKLKQMQHLMHTVVLKENEINEKEQIRTRFMFQKEMELSLKQNLLSQEANRLQKEQDYYKELECDLRKLQELVQRQKEPLCERVTISVRNIETQTDFDNYATRNSEIESLTKEKQELINLVQEQQSRIEQLTLRTVQLSRQLEELNFLKLTNSPIVIQSKAQSRYPNAIISDNSSTEDILHDAKMRLKRLEEENTKANQYYFNCIATSP